MLLHFWLPEPFNGFLTPIIRHSRTLNLRLKSRYDTSINPVKLRKSSYLNDNLLGIMPIHDAIKPVPIAMRRRFICIRQCLKISHVLLRRGIIPVPSIFCIPLTKLGRIIRSWMNNLHISKYHIGHLFQCGCIPVFKLINLCLAT